MSISSRGLRVQKSRSCRGTGAAIHSSGRSVLEILRGRESSWRLERLDRREMQGIDLFSDTKRRKVPLLGYEDCVYKIEALRRLRYEPP